MIQPIQLKCPYCGAAVTTETKICEYCANPIVLQDIKQIQSFTPVQINKYVSSYKETLTENPKDKLVNGSIALCFLQLKLYDKAIEHFELAIEDNFENPDTYYYLCIAKLKGQKAFTTPRPEIDKILEYIHAAQQIEQKPIYFYFEAYIKYDFFKRKFLNVPPKYEDLLATAKSTGLAQEDADTMFAMLGVEKPAQLQ